MIGAAFFTVLILSYGLLAVDKSYAFGGCEENCQKCHSLSKDEVIRILSKTNVKDAAIIKIQISPIKGLWEVAVENKGQRGLLYIDFSGKYLMTGQILEVNASVDRTKQRLDELNKDKRINPASIPLKDALIVGSSTASKKIIVFTDPD